MREIKFRAWDKKRARMLTVFSMTTSPETHAVDCVWCGETMDEVVDGFDINDIELMQFTGLLDKNGKEIYEGDIYAHNAVLGHGLPPKAVEWEVWGNKNVGFSLPQGSLEVVGNIYENPELLI